jgi:hypothetical protein
LVRDAGEAAERVRATYTRLCGGERSRFAIAGAGLGLIDDRPEALPRRIQTLCLTWGRRLAALVTLDEGGLKRGTRLLESTAAAATAVVRVACVPAVEQATAPRCLALKDRGVFHRATRGVTLVAHNRSGHSPQCEPYSRRRESAHPMRGHRLPPL